MKKVFRIMAFALFGTALCVACEKEQEEYKTLRADCGHLGSVNTTEDGYLNAFDLIDENGDVVGYRIRLDANARPSFIMYVTAKEPSQTYFDLSDVDTGRTHISVAASQFDYDVKELRMQLLKPLSSLNEGEAAEDTFSGMFVLDSSFVRVGNSGYYERIDDTVMVTDGYFKITPYWWH